MRPGQLTPENDSRRLHFAGESLASMRPGQLTPENELADWHTYQLLTLQ